jgi:hypothetical protein
MPFETFTPATPTGRRSRSRVDAILARNWRAPQITDTEWENVAGLLEQRRRRGSVPENELAAFILGQRAAHPQTCCLRSR